MKKIPIPVLAPLAAAAIAFTACSTPPVIRDSGPSTSPTSARSAVQQYESDRRTAEKREWEANAAVGLPPSVDRGLAEASAKDGVPFVFSVDSCSYLRLPDRSLWSLKAGGALLRDTDLGETLARWNGALPGYACQPGTAPQFDAASADAANRESVPYRWRDSCRSYVRMPGSAAKWALPTAPSVNGEVLSDAGLGYGCDSGVDRPGQSSALGSCDDGTTLPGETSPTPCPSSTGSRR